MSKRIKQFIQQLVARFSKSFGRGSEDEVRQEVVGKIRMTKTIDTTGLRAISKEQLDDIVEKHQLWLSSSGEQGEKARLYGLILEDVVLDEKDLREADLSGSSLWCASLRFVKLDGACLDNTILVKTDLSNASLKAVNATNAKFSEANLFHANLEGAILQDADFSHANLSSAFFNGATLDGANLAFATADEVIGQSASCKGTNFQRASLSKSDFLKSDLSESLLGWSNLFGAKLYSVNLRNADLRWAILKRADLEGADLNGAQVNRQTDLRDINFQDADISGVKGLMTEYLGGVNLSGAKLPDSMREFEGIAVANDLSKSARTQFLAMLLGCVYVWLTVATTKDAHLITNAASSPLPIINTTIPIVGFYLLAPVLLLSVYLYFHIYMQRLWEILTTLPAFFPEGRALDQRVSPWLMIGFIRIHLFRLKDNLPAFLHPQVWLSTVLAWWLVPGTVVFLWVRYLPRHDWLGTIFHVIVITIAFSMAVAFQKLRARALNHESSVQAIKEQLTGTQKDVVPVINAKSIIILAIILLILSFGAINGIRVTENLQIPWYQYADPRVWVPGLLQTIGAKAFADFVETDISVKPENWAIKRDISLIKGALMRKADLRYLSGRNAFLINANLQGANLIGADLRGAQLSGANLTLANLEGADLSGADLTRVKFTEANLNHTKLRDADLSGADLSRAFNLTREQLGTAASLKGAKLPQKLDSIN
jgi:uncharacterized protein YjbI with pentapeptide repeats